MHSVIVKCTYSTGTEDCFGSPLPDDDPILRALRHDCNPNELADAIRAFSSGFSEVLVRQLDKYLNGVLSAPTPEMFEKTQNAALHNMGCEGILAMVDMEMRRAPNAQMDLISGKVKYVKNNTMSWLSSKSIDEQRKVIKSAVRQRRSVAKLLKERKQRNINTVKQRLYELLLKKQQKQTKEMEKKITITKLTGNNFAGSPVGDLCS